MVELINVSYNVNYTEVQVAHFNELKIGSNCSYKFQYNVTIKMSRAGLTVTPVIIQPYVDLWVSITIEVIVVKSAVAAYTKALNAQ